MRTEHIHLDSGTVEGALRELGTHAIERGYAANGYVEAVLDREREFPTGLVVATAPFDVAIPHTDPEHVHEEAVIVGLPDDPIPFPSMDDPDETVDARVVLLLLSGESDGYAEFLSNLATLLSNPGFTDAVQAENGDRILDLVEEKCL